MEIKLKPRKITKINYTYYVSIPHTWINHHGIEKESMVCMKIGEDGILKIAPILEVSEND